MKRIGRRPFLLGSAILAACGGKVADEPSDFGNVTNPPAPPATSNPFPTDPGFPDASAPVNECRDNAPNARLSSLTGVGAPGPLPAIVYSWTTAEQAAGLRAGDPLFTKATTPGGDRGHLFTLLEKRAAEGDVVAETLAGPAFELGRFAWPFAAGTRSSPEDYGDVLLAIELKKEALIVAFSSQRGGIYVVYDLAGNVVTQPRLDPSRIGAFFFTNDENTTPVTGLGLRCRPNTISGGLTYRELYLGNIAMLAGYSLSTPAIHARLDAEAKDLRTLAEGLDCKGFVLGDCDAVASAWERARTRTRLEGFYRSLAFATPFGSSDAGPRALRTLADELDGLDRTGAPLVITL